MARRYNTKIVNGNEFGVKGRWIDAALHIPVSTLGRRCRKTWNITSWIIRVSVSWSLNTDVNNGIDRVTVERASSRMRSIADINGF